MTHRVTKPILLGLLGVSILAYLGLLTSLNLARYEQMTVTQAQRYLSILARTQANHLEDLFAAIQTEMEIAAANPAVRRVFAGPAESLPDEGGPQPLEDMHRRLNSIVVSICELDAAGRLVGQIPNKPETKLADCSAWPDVRGALKRQQATLSETLTLPNGSKAVSLCVPVFDDRPRDGLAARDDSARCTQHADRADPCGDSRLCLDRGPAWGRDQLP